MNNILKILCFTLGFYLFNGCGKCDDCEGDGNYLVKAQITYVNETSTSIKVIECDKIIAAKSTLKIDAQEVLGVKPNVDNFPLSIFPTCRMAYTDGDLLKCESGLRNIINYTDRKELSPLVFEFTFKFTEEKKAVAKLCN